MGAYDNPKSLSGMNPTMAALSVLMKGDQSRGVDEAQRLREKQAKERQNQAVIKQMQNVQGAADVWNLEQMSNLSSAPKTSAIDTELQRTLNGRIDIATQAQIYLKTQFGDNEKRLSAQKAIKDYYDLLDLTKKTVTSFAATGEYWKQNAATIGKKITILGKDQNEIANNQFFLNSIGDVVDGQFEMVYDPESNDIMVKVSGYETGVEDGKTVQGDYREKIISARKWNAQVNEGSNFDFVSNVPQVVNESLDMMKTKEQSKNGNGIGVIANNGQIDPRFWTEDTIVYDTIKVEGNEENAQKTTEIRNYLNMESLRNEMEGILTQKISGVNTNVQTAANAWNIDLQKLNQGFENDYQTINPTDDQFKDALFEQIVKANTSNLKQDSEGRWYKSRNKAIVKLADPIEGPGYRAEYYNNIMNGAMDNSQQTNMQVVSDNMNRISPGTTLMDRDEIIDLWLTQPNDQLSSVTNQEYYDRSKIKKQNNGKGARSFAEDLYGKEGFYKVKGNSISFAGNYNLESAVDRLKFALDNSTSDERKSITNKTILMDRAEKTDWMKANPMGATNAEETEEEYIKRMNKALNIK